MSLRDRIDRPPVGRPVHAPAAGIPLTTPLQRGVRIRRAVAAPKAFGSFRAFSQTVEIETLAAPQARFDVQGSTFKVRRSRFKVQGSRFKVRRSRFDVQGSRFWPHPWTLCFRLRRAPKATGWPRPTSGLLPPKRSCLDPAAARSRPCPGRELPPARGQDCLVP